VREKKEKFFFSLFLTVLLLVVGLLTWHFLSSRNGRSLPQLSFSGRHPNVILITVDTLRADRLGCYGFTAIDTPTIDLFGSRGIQFERCIAQTPLTLPSHVTILTGTLPLFHGVRDNGGFLVPKDLVTMAEVFHEAGFATAAFVGAYVLDSRWGLDQGFDYYFDQFDLSDFEMISFSMVQRRANEVMDEALRWLEAKKDRPFFTWIHLYDPHSPYEPPEPFANKYDHPYLGEIAFVDSELRRLWDFLETRRLLTNSVLIFTSDHGESLGEHREETHGFFIYEEAIHVPLIFVTPIRKLQGISVPQTVALADIMPTLLEMIGLPVPEGVQGRSLIPLFFKPQRKSDRFIYAETFYPRFHFGWSELCSVQKSPFKLIIAPEPELYDLETDPEETSNLAASEGKLLDSLLKEARDFMDDHSRGAFQMNPGPVDEETREKLAALGYIGSFTSLSATSDKKLANPRDKIDVFNELSRAREMGMGGNAGEAIAVIEKIIAQDSDISEAHSALGDIHFRLGRYEEAVIHFLRSLVLKPDDTFAVLNVANCYLRLKRADEAESFLLEFVQKGFPDSQVFFLLGYIQFSQRNYERAIHYYQQCVSLNPDSASAHNALGAVHFLLHDLDQAEEHFRRALSLNPEFPNVNYNLARVYEEKGMNKEAMDAYRQELRYSPRHFKACFNLAYLYRQADDDLEEERLLKVCLEENPAFPLTHFYLARILLNRGENLDRAFALIQQGISLKPEREDLALGYFLLADLYKRQGNLRLSLEYARKSKELSQPSPPQR